MSTDRLVAGTLAILGALAGIPLALAQLDFAGVVDAFEIDHGEAPAGVLVLAAIGGTITVVVVALGLAGAALCFVGSPGARPLLIVAAVAGFASALMLWLPAALALGAAVHLLGRAEEVELSRAAPR